MYQFSICLTKIYIQNYRDLIFKVRRVMCYFGESAKPVKLSFNKFLKDLEGRIELYLCYSCPVSDRDLSVQIAGWSTVPLFLNPLASTRPTQTCLLAQEIIIKFMTYCTIRYPNVYCKAYAIRYTIGQILLSTQHIYDLRNYYYYQCIFFQVFLPYEIQELFYMFFRVSLIFI